MRGSLPWEFVAHDEGNKNDLRALFGNDVAIKEFQAFPQDGLDAKQYQKLEMPVLGLASNHEGLQASLAPDGMRFRNELVYASVFSRRYDASRSAA